MQSPRSRFSRRRFGTMTVESTNSPDELAMPQWHREELERRLAAADASPDASIPWEQVLKSINHQR